ncbi:MAG: IS200/IS605 family transposase [Thermodesulfobacteriota bacterium]
MAGTFTQIYIQIVIAVNGRNNLLSKTWREEVFKYMSGIIKNKGHKPIIVNGVGDHVHIFIGLKPSMSVFDLIRDIKNNSTNFINNQNWVRGKFSWQEGYGAFSYGHSQMNMIYNYIKNQEKHHHKKTFQEEYLEFLDKFDVFYKELFVSMVKVRLCHPFRVFGSG